MNRKTVFLCGFVVAVVTAVVVRQHERVEPFVSNYEDVLGTSMAVTVLASSSSEADAVGAAVLASIERDAKTLSAYDPTSEFSQWMRTRDVARPVSQELVEVLSLFDAWRERTGGALDPSAEGVSRVWKAAALEGRVPTGVELGDAVAAVRQTHWRVDPVARTAAHLSDAPLILNSFTKSYIVDRAARVGLAAGASGIVVNIGGDIVTRGNWTEMVAIRDPLAPADNATPLTRLSVRGKTVATSGGYRRGFDIDGRHYSHIVDPRTGQPAGHVLSATVVADDAVDAGALATAMCVLTPEQSERVAAGRPGVEFMLVMADGSRIESQGWRALQAKPSRRLALPNPVATLLASEQTWDPSHQLTVTVELARIGGRATRPYLAVWIEDKDRYPIRTLALWVEKLKWLPDLRSWYRGDRLRSMAEGSNLVNSVSSPTRAPGRYTLSWDGKDQQGKLVKPGVYTVLIEAAREHGTYQIMRQEMDFSGVAKHVDLPGNIEVTSAALDYQKVAAR